MIETIRNEAREHIPEAYFEVTAGVVGGVDDLTWSDRYKKFRKFPPNFKPRMFSDRLLLTIRPKRRQDAVDNLFHRLWTKAVGTKDYDKTEWLTLEKVINGRL